MTKQNAEPQPSSGFIDEQPKASVNLLEDAAREKEELGRSTGRSPEELDVILHREALDAQVELRYRVPLI
jgi:hypothetical protein